MNQINPITPRIDTVTILQGEDDQRLRELRATVDRLKPKKGGEPATLDETSALQAAEEAVEEFKAEAEERGVKVVLRALGRKTWRDLIAKHPPREDNEGDKALGANTETFEEELVAASIASPTFSSVEERDHFLDSLSIATFGELGIKAWSLNMGSAASPKD